MARTYAQHCGLARALDRVGERWTLLVVRELLLGPARYSDLRAALPGMATNLLADRLRALEAEGIVVRRTLPPPAAASVYELTELGHGLEEAVHALVRWGGRFMADGPPGDALRPGWLAIALQALAHGRDAPAVVCGLVVDGQELTLTSSGGGLDVRVGAEAPPDVVLTTDGRTMLAIASGARGLEEALESGTVRAEGSEAAVAALAEVWRGGNG